MTIIYSIIAIVFCVCLGVTPIIIKLAKKSVNNEETYTTGFLNKVTNFFIIFTPLSYNKKSCHLSSLTLK